ncbi:MAG: ABC transporter substrate-binding protein [Elusimicrobiota bacterium]|nr:ABC transporter substrate-binding protein [Elusimicrobiota bacterium]
MRRLRAAPAALAALLLAAPARPAEDPTSLRYALSSDIDSLDPHWAYDAVSLFVTDQVYETLVDFAGAATDAFEPRVASVVPSRENGFISADGLTYAFPLRRGIKFHDGTPVTPEDVRYSLLRFMLLDRAGGPSSLLLEPLLGLNSTKELPPEQVWALADKAVRLEGGALMIRLKRPFAPLLSLLANFAPVVSRKTVADAGGWDGEAATWTRHRDPAKEQSALYARANGTGPFKLMKWDRAAGVVLERHDGYWRSPAALSTVVLRVSHDARERVLLLDRGEVDLAVIERRFVPRFAGAPGIVVQDGLPNLEAQSVILLNQAVEAKDNPWLGSGRLDGKGIPPDFLADPDIRRGLALAFDYDRFIAEAYQGQAERARGPVPRGVWGRYDRLPLPVASTVTARAAFQRALKGQAWALGFRLPVAYNESRGEWRFACRLLKERVEALNPLFSVDCRPVPQSQVLDEFRARRLPAFIYRWVLDYPDPHNAIEPFLHSSGYFAGPLGYRNPRVDRMVEAAAAEQDATVRKKMYHELQLMASVEVPAVFTVDAWHAVVRRAKVLGFVYNPITPYGSLYEVSKLP